MLKRAVVLDVDDAAVDSKKEIEMDTVKQRFGLGEMPDDALNDFGFAINRMHDPCNFDHTTIEDMLSTYATRNLEKSKIFRIAKHIFGDKMDPKFKTRKRIFNVSGMKNMKAKATEPELFEESDDELLNMSDLRLHQPCVSQLESLPSSNCDAMKEAALMDYKHWIEARKKLRAGLESLGLTKQWLLNKPDKTEREAELLKQLQQDVVLPVTMQDEDATVVSVPVLSANQGLPKIKRPSPLAIQKIERYLKQNQVRLVDIFSAADKNKDWKISRAEFMATVKQYNMDISLADLEDLIGTMDTNDEGVLYYKHLAKGVDLYRIERREAKRKGVQLEIDASELETEQRSPSPSNHLGYERIISAGETKSKPGNASAGSSSSLLSTPERDLSEERLVLKSQEAQVDIRKRDKGFLRLYKGAQFNAIGVANKPNISLSTSQSASKTFTTGYKPVDDHCKISTLRGETGAMIDNFRQLKLREYYEILSHCEQKGVVLSRQLLDEVLLHPADKSERTLLRQGIAQPGAFLPHSRHFADPPKKPRTPIEIRNRGKMKRDADGSLLIDYKHLFPFQSKAARTPTKMTLSTGKAYVSRQVDCWLTFEEFDRMTRHFYKRRFVKMGGSKNDQMFWPGYMLDKVRLVLPDDKTASSTNPLFHEIRAERRHNHGYDNDLNNWPITDNGYLQQGSIRHPKTTFDTTHHAHPPDRPLMYKNHFVHKITDNLTMHTNL